MWRVNAISEVAGLETKPRGFASPTRLRDHSQPQHTRGVAPATVRVHRRIRALPRVARERLVDRQIFRWTGNRASLDVVRLSRGSATRQRRDHLQHPPTRRTSPFSPNSLIGGTGESGGGSKPPASVRASQEFGSRNNDPRSTFTFVNIAGVDFSSIPVRGRLSRVNNESLCWHCVYRSSLGPRSCTIEVQDQQREDDRDSRRG